MSALKIILQSLKSSLKENKWPLILYMSIGFLFLAIVQSLGGQLFGSDTQLCGFGYDFMSESLRNGQMPYWNPYLNSGMPQMSSMNHLVFFPTAMIFLLLGMSPGNIFLYECFTALLLGGIFMYFFIRSLKISKLTASIAGVFFIACGSFFTYINPGHDNMMLAVAMLPGIYYFITRGVNEDKITHYILAGFLIGIQSMLCLYQMVFYTVICITVYFACLYFLNKKSLKHLLYFFVSGVTTFLTSAILLFPAYYFIKHTFRAGVSYDFFTSWSLHPLETIVYIYPKFFGFLESTYWGKSQFWLHNDYLGIIPWIFVFAAIFFVFKDKYVKIFLFMAIGIMIMAFGGYTPIYKLLFKIPIVNGFRNSSRWLGFFAFSIVTLAAFGFEHIKNYFATKKETLDISKMKVFLKTLLVIDIIFACIYFLFSVSRSSMVNNLKGIEQFNKRFPAQSLDYVANILYQMIRDDMFLFVLYFSIGMAFVYLVVKGKMGKGLFFSGCLLMALLDNGVRFMAPRTFNVAGAEYSVQCVKAGPANQEDPRRTDIRNFLSRDSSIYRVMPVGDLFNKNWFISDKIQSCGGYHSAPLENYTTIQNKGFLNDFRFLSLLNVKYVLSETQINHPYLKLVNDGRVKIYQNIAVFPRVSLYSRVTVIEKEKMFIKMQEQSFDAQTSILVNESIPEILDNIKYNGQEAVISKYESNKIEIETDSPGNSVLFLSEVYYPEWKAYIDGKETKIYQAFGLFRSIYLPKGKHKVEFKWDPKIFYLGAVASLSVLLLVIIMGIFIIKQKEKGFQDHKLMGNIKKN